MKQQKNKKVLVFGTFDGLHEGHLNFFRQAKEYGDYLIAVIARDENVKNLKGKLPKFSEKERLYQVQKCELVDETMLGDKMGYTVIEKINPDVVCIGYDQKYSPLALKMRLEKMHSNADVIVLKPYKPEQFHSSIINKQ